MSVDAILLAGGRGSRVDGAAKPLFRVGGSTLLAAAIAAARAGGAQRILVVAPVLDAALDVEWIAEDPPFGGPVAGVVAALPVVRADEVLVLACDLVAPAQAVAALPAIPADADGVCLSSDGRPQWLTGRYRTAALRCMASGLENGGRDAAMRTLLGGLRIALVDAPAEVSRDIDTWDDLTAAGGTAASEPEEEP
ncbi:molybdenum cofactor guanylyltransferase [Microbacterium sp. Bi128]|uniref:molybdenum cofactor guanylyltransferase n=1 Tax=Microbacterium sp. Bi128 TaxID=2821115 RepID=UPI001DF8959E|nr:NTP transferase domain-containing protein [Microbacterium sp. Bi128]CAH0230141.1 Molybdenum cofactor guanylyltransferase [Microbacterium sp. Bi128]